MFKFLLLGILALVLWYVLAPYFTPAPLRKPRRKSKLKDDDNIIEGKGRIIE